MKKKLYAIIVLIMVCACTFSGCSFSFFTSDKPTTTYTSPITIPSTAGASEIVDACIDAVVTVFITNKSTNEDISFGSGVAIASGGYIATNYHVISLIATTSNYKIRVYHNNSETSHNATLLWYNVNFDCAIIKCSCGDLPFVSMEDRFIETEKPLKALEQVIAIGTPVDFSLQNSATLGYVSSKEGRLSYSDGIVYENLIQHTAPINHGNSGGPLFDMNGKLIGLNTLGNDEANSLFFAVPIYPISKVIDRVVSADSESKKWTTPILGFAAVDKYQASYAEIDFDSDGMKITTITAGGPSVGKLLENDVVTAIKIGDTTFDVTLRNDLLFNLIKANKGDVVTITYVRGLIRNTTNITLG